MSHSQSPIYLVNSQRCLLPRVYMERKINGPLLVMLTCLEISMIYFKYLTFMKTDGSSDDNPCICFPPPFYFKTFKMLVRLVFVLSF